MKVAAARALPPALLTILFAAALAGCSDPAPSGPQDDGGAADAPQPPLPDQRPEPEPDLGPPDAPGPMANVYLVNPVADDHVTSEVMLQHLTDPSGKLTGSHADVWNCLQEQSGAEIELNLAGQPISGKLCTPRQSARFSAGQGYLHISPPASDTDGNDAFAEVMAYHHITTIHDHYSGTFGLHHIDDEPLYSIVNVQGYANPLATWIGLPNAMYVPSESSPMLEELLGVDFLEGREALVFGYNNLPFLSAALVDFSYDASVLYHEYTHYVIGGDRLQQDAPDLLGLDPTPIALNEALADYFPCSFLETPLMGTYALGDGARDLTRTLRCPGHLAGESHHDGEIASSALWAARSLVGHQILDQAIWDAVLTFSIDTTYEQAFAAILEEVKLAAPDKSAAVEALLESRGLLSCPRVQPHQDLDAAQPGAFPPRYAGKATAPLTFSGGVPAYMQFIIPVHATTKEIVIEYQPVTTDVIGMGSGKGDVAVALKPGGVPIHYDYGGATATSDAAAVLKGQDLGEDGYRLALSGSCITEGDLIYQFINLGSAPGQLQKVTVVQSEIVTSPTPTFDCP